MSHRAELFHAVVSGRRRGLLAGVARRVLWLAQWPYALAVWWRNRRYDRNPGRAVRVPVPVICVGNLTTGGTGKTVCVESAARFLRDEGQSVAILSRGYGSPDGGPNDEALLLEDNLPDVPHLQGADRVALAMTAIEELEPDVLVLDDGFQHRRLHRDLDIVLIDAGQPILAENYLPRGRLRESVNALRRAHLVILTRCDPSARTTAMMQRQWIQNRFPQLPIAAAVHQPCELLTTDGEPLDPELLSGRSIAAFCGIAQPESFPQTLADLGATVTEFRTFPDHHSYTRDDIADLERWANTLPPETWILTTQKDWVKLRIPALQGRPLRALRIELRFVEGEEHFRAALRSVLREPLPSDTAEEWSS